MLCGYCDKEFTPKNQRRRFCSDKCRSADWQRKRVALPVAEAKEIRAKLALILDAAWEAKATLEKYGGG